MGKVSDSLWKDVLGRIDDRFIIELARDMIKIPSVNPPGGEGEVAAFLSSKMEEIGLKVRGEEVFPGRPNIYGVIGGKRGHPILNLNGHLDVVPPGKGWSMDPHGGIVRDGRLYGRGACDMKAGIAAMVGAAKAILDAGAELEGDLLISAVVDEEAEEAGIKHMVEKGIRSDYAVVGEPTEMEICIACKGDIYYEIVTEGLSAHASVPKEGINAIYKMMKIIDAIKAFSTKLEGRRHSLLTPPTINVGTIEGGTITSAVPAHCRITVDRRILPNETPEGGKRELEALIEDLRREDPELKARVSILMEALPMEVSEDEEIFKTMQEAIEEVLGYRPSPKGFTAVCDAQVLVNQAKTPTVIFGPGSISQAHKPDEYVEIDQVIDAAKIYAMTALNLLS